MSDVLRSVSDGLAGVVEATSPGIVRVEARRRLPGTGIVWSSDGIIVTAHHIIERNENIQLGLEGERTLSATLVGRDANTDIAVLRADGDLSVPNWSQSDDLKVGHLVLALGRPGINVQATLGVVSALDEERPVSERGGGGRERRRGGGRPMNFGGVGPAIQTDVVMYPGFSGGPLVDAAGVVRGINTSALSRGTSLTIPTATVRSVVESLLSHGKVRRGYLGVGAQPVRLPANLKDQLGQEVGLMLVQVDADSPAEKGGLLLGDILIALDGYTVQVIDDLLMLLGSDRAGRESVAKVIRGGQLVDVTVAIGERE